MASVSFMGMVLICFDFILASLGVILMVMGIQGSPFSEEMLNVHEIAIIPRLLIAVAFIMILLATLQILGLSTQCPNILLVFLMYFMIVCIIQVVVLGILYLGADPMNRYTKNTLERWVRDYETDNQTKLALDMVQMKFNCCGVNGPDDWESGKRPFSCCYNVESNDTEPICPTWLANPTGCHHAIFCFIRQFMNDHFWIFLLIACVEMLYATISCFEWADMVYAFEDDYMIP